MRRHNCQNNYNKCSNMTYSYAIWLSFTRAISATSSNLICWVVPQTTHNCSLQLKSLISLILPFLMTYRHPRCGQWRLGSSLTGYSGCQWMRLICFAKHPSKQVELELSPTRYRLNRLLRFLQLALKHQRWRAFQNLSLNYYFREIRYLKRLGRQYLSVL